MEYTIENEYLKVTVTTWGAQVKSVLRKCDGVEHIWQADKSVWGYHAPILFPHTGKVVDGIIEAKGGRYESGQHGFARLMEHQLVAITEDSIVMELRASEETLAKFPYEFALISTITLENDTVHHSLTVENWDEEELPFGIGYHPAFTVPFDDTHEATDYELRFNETESPLCIGCLPKGLVHGNCYYLGNNIKSIPVDEHLFDNDSHCMVNLKSTKLGLYEKGTGRGVVCDIENFPYTLIWSKPGVPKFICIEPWQSLPSPENGSSDWNEKPAAAILAPGESWTTTLSTSFVR
ncbi:MAG: aldose 1-epimerase family protein [Oscillospiraceae bacterium]|nr:aldose 1-epimerase family protein [Oscillospiraceae bacterium]